MADGVRAAVRGLRAAAECWLADAVVTDVAPLLQRLHRPPRPVPSVAGGSTDDDGDELAGAGAEPPELVTAVVVATLADYFDDFRALLRPERRQAVVGRCAEALGLAYLRLLLEPASDSGGSSSSGAMELPSVARLETELSLLRSVFEPHLSAPVLAASLSEPLGALLDLLHCPLSDFVASFQQLCWVQQCAGAGAGHTAASQPPPPALGAPSLAADGGALANADALDGSSGYFLVSLAERVLALRGVRDSVLVSKYSQRRGARTEALRGCEARLAAIAQATAPPSSWPSAPPPRRKRRRLNRQRRACATFVHTCSAAAVVRAMPARAGVGTSSGRLSY